LKFLRIFPHDILKYLKRHALMEIFEKFST